MSKPTLQERAREYLAFSMGMRLPLIDQEQNQMWRHLTAFAAREVARVREAQIVSLMWLRANVTGVRDGGGPGLSRRLNMIDAATRAPRKAKR